MPPLEGERASGSAGASERGSGGWGPHSPQANGAAIPPLDPRITPFASEILSHHSAHGDQTIIVKKDRTHDLLKFLKEDPELKFEMLMDLAGVDYRGETPRFEVVYHLYSISHNHRLRVRVKVPEADPRIGSVISLWKAADWFERECFDMFGIEFEGHPNLKRILLYEGFEGHPLRKDYPITRRQRMPVPEEVL